MYTKKGQNVIPLPLGLSGARTESWTALWHLKIYNLLYITHYELHWLASGHAKKALGYALGHVCGCNSSSFLALNDM